MITNKFVISKATKPVAATLPTGVAMRYFDGMKQIFVLLLILLAVGLSPAMAQQDADDQYLIIYSLIQQADGLAASGQPRQALVQYAQIQTELTKFQKVYPEWNPKIVSFRLKYVAEKIADVTARLPVAGSPPQTTASTSSGQGTTPAVSESELTALRRQLQQLQADNTTLAAKLREALSVQPAAIDSRELTRAQQQIESLMKQNDLLKTTLAERGTRTNVVTVSADAEALRQAQAALVSVNRKLEEQTRRTDQLAQENLALQSRVQTLMASPDTLEALRAENELLKRQIADLKQAAAKARDATKIEDDVKQAQLQIAKLQSDAQVSQLEKAALENRLKKSEAKSKAAVVAVAPVPVPAVSASSPDQANNDARIHELTKERDDLAAKLNAANKELHARKAPPVSTQVAALNEEIKTLRGRLAVDEAQPVPYTPEELALFKSAPPATQAAQKNPETAMPAGSEALVAQAQSFFASRQYDRAETNYLQMLERDPKNVVVLGNLAAIEMEEGKLDDAGKHLEAALAQNPDDSYNLSRLGYLKFQQGKYDEALDSLSRAAKLDPQNAEIQNYLGVALSHKGLRVQAETALRKAIQIDPKYAAAQNNLAVIYLSQQPPLVQLARWHYQKALDAGQPRNPDLEKAMDEAAAAKPGPQ
jgi:tetratricopeptide (TPR) repeat protein